MKWKYFAGKRTFLLQRLLYYNHIDVNQLMKQLNLNLFQLIITHQMTMSGGERHLYIKFIQGHSRTQTVMELAI